MWLVGFDLNETVFFKQRISDTVGGFTGVLDNGDQFGAALALVEDQNGDGVDEIAVGAPFDDDGGTNRGAVWLLSTTGKGIVVGHQKISATSGGFPGALADGDRFGSALASQDLDADGRADLVAGAPAADGGGLNRGALWLLTLDGSSPVQDAFPLGDGAGGFTGPLDDGDVLGFSLAALGDLDGDGFGDLAAGAPGDDDGGSGRGALYVLRLDGVRASATVRNGSGINALCYQSPAGPVLGGTWSATVSTAGHPGALFTAIGGYLAPAAGPVIPGFGELLVDLESSQVFLSLVPSGGGPSDLHSTPVPANPSLAGLALPTQATILDAAGGEFCNAVDLVIGF